MHIFRIFHKLGAKRKFHGNRTKIHESSSLETIVSKPYRWMQSREKPYKHQISHVQKLAHWFSHQYGSYKSSIPQIGETVGTYHEESHISKSKRAHCIDQRSRSPSSRTTDSSVCGSHDENFEIFHVQQVRFENIWHNMIYGDLFHVFCNW